MRIAVATDDQVTVAAHPGRCAGFATFEVHGGLAKPVDYRPNTFTAHARGECTDHATDHHAGHHSHAGLLDALSDCQALITAGMGRRLIVDLLAAGVQPYVASQRCSVEEAVGRFARGEFEPATQDSACTHHA